MPVEHSRHHPDVHQPWADWSEDQRLHVAAAYSNPFRWRTRRELTNDFRRHMQQSPNVVLHMGELAYGDRPFEVTDSTEANDVQLRTTAEMFHKENILNLTIQHFPSNWRYGAIIDSDFHMTRHDWALEAVHQLQHYDFVQLFSGYSDLSGELYGSGHVPTRLMPGFAYNYIQGGYKLPDGYAAGGWKKDGTPAYYYGAGIPGLRPVGATGGAWAFRRSAFETVGGLLDICILGHGDWFMAFGLVMEEAPEAGLASYTSGYRRVIDTWQRNASKLKKNIGYIDNFALHFFHGSKAKRAYTTRFRVLVDNRYDPVTDLVRNHQGVYQLSGNKPALRDGIRSYFISRNEDELFDMGDTLI